MKMQLLDREFPTRFLSYALFLCIAAYVRKTID
jgi:hypothetical protein